MNHNSIKQYTMIHHSCKDFPINTDLFRDFDGKWHLIVNYLWHESERFVKYCPFCGVNLNEL